MEAMVRRGAVLLRAPSGCLCDDPPVNLFDAFAVLLVVAAVLLGYRSGTLPQVGGLIGALSGGAVALLAIPLLEDQLASVDAGIRPWLVLVGLFGAVIIGESIGSSVGAWAGQGVRRSVFSGVDRLGGSLFAGAQALLVLWLAGGVFASGPMPRLAEAAQTSAVIRTLNATLPPPTDLAVGLGRLLDDSGLGHAFIGFEPLPAPPVDRPDDPQAQSIAAAAEASTLRIASGPCGALESTGTGFVVASGYVVTNAHVIAGGQRVVVTGIGGRYDATPVLFDPDFDIALLRVPNLVALALPLATRDPDRGAPAAVLGYPNGGPLRIVSAAVADGYAATGRNIYGTEQVRREIVEIRSDIERGNSGGPLMLADGTVGGVVFAEARTDEEVGYALAPTAVAERINPFIGSTEPVATGECLTL
jgi:S1-C subfamily serine protease